MGELRRCILECHGTRQAATFIDRNVGRNADAAHRRSDGHVVND
jgi:hypothetical protein